MPHAFGLRRGLIEGASIPRRRAHIRGETRSEATRIANADIDGKPDVVALAPTIGDAALAELVAQRKRYLRKKAGAKPKTLAEFVVWGPPRHASVAAWPRDRSIAWGRDTVAWVQRHFADSPITEAALHMDEGSPHIHVAIFPRYTDAVGETAYGWKRAERAAAYRLAGRPTLLNAGKQTVRGREKAGADMSALLDDYHATIGAKYGLERGVKGSERKHKAVQVDEASRAHADDRKQELAALAALLTVRESEFNARLANFDDLANAVHREQEQTAQEQAQEQRRLDTQAAELREQEWKAKRIAQELVDCHVETEKRRRKKAEADLAKYRAVADPLIRASRARRVADAAEALRDREAKEAAEAKRDREAKEAAERAKARTIPFFRRERKRHRQTR